MSESISYTEYKKLMNRVAGWLVKNKKQFKKRDAYGYMNKVSKKAEVEAEALKAYNAGAFGTSGIISEYVECAVEDNKDLGFLPNYVSSEKGVKYYKNCFVSMARRVAAYEVEHKVSPAIVYVYDNHGNGTTSNTTDVTLQKVRNALGNFNTIDEFLSKIKGRGYGYYYNNRYNTDTTIYRLKNKLPLNCTDITQLMYRIGIALGYTCQIIHVKCKGGDGHVRIRLKHPKHTNGNWIYRDGAAVLKGGAVTSNWCMNGTLLAYDPKWIFDSMFQ